MSIEQGKTTAIAAYPKLASASVENGHNRIAIETEIVVTCEHPRDTILEPDQSVSVCAEPQIAVAVGIDVPCMNTRHRLVTGAGNPVQPTGQIQPDIALRVFIGAVCFGPGMKTIRLEPFNRAIDLAGDTRGSAVPARAGVVLHNVKDLIRGYASAGGNIRVLDQPAAVPLAQPPR